MKRKGFTLIELISVIVLLAIILAIAVPTITGIIKNSAKNAFESDAKLVLKGVDYKKIENESFDPTKVNKDNVYELLGISNSNYKNLTITLESGIPIISIIGTNKWDGFIACGTFKNMKVVEEPSKCDIDSVPPVLTILGDNPVNMYIGDTYIDAGAIATDNMMGDITEYIVVTGTVNPNVPGKYTITYSVKDIFDNESVATRIVNVIDNVYPTITFNPNGNSTYAKSRTTTIAVADLGILDNNSLKYVWTTSDIEPSSDSFANAYINNQIISTPNGGTGSYYLWAVAIDTAGNKTVTGSNAFNLDNTPPVITITGSNPVTVNGGSVYSDAGATATDAHSGINGSVTSSSNVNTNALGSYTVTYSVGDNAGNSATATRTVNVVDNNPPIVTANNSSFTITQGASNALPGSYFTINQNGLSAISSTVCINTSNGNATVTNTSTLSVGTHVIKCTTTKTNGLNAFATTTFTVNPAYTCSQGTLTYDAGKGGYICVGGYGSGAVSYDSCYTSSCNYCTYTYRTYGSNSSCGYATCQNSACGYASCPNSSCGCSTYTSWVLSYTTMDPSCAQSIPDNEYKMTSCIKRPSGVDYDIYVYTRSCATYKSCQNSSCGYASCATSACGYASCYYDATTSGYSCSDCGSTCNAAYYCPAGWSSYSGSGINLKCYKAAIKS